MPADVAVLRRWVKRLSGEPIPPTDDRYVPLQESGRSAVDSIFGYISLRTETTAQLLSGPSGSGKTTELLRLKRDLEEEGFTVVLVDMLRYVSQSAPIDAVEFSSPWGWRSASSYWTRPRRPSGASPGGSAASWSGSTCPSTSAR